MFKRFLDELEIEDWYETRMQELSQEFKKKALDRKDVERARVKYTQKVNNLVIQYEKEHKKLVQRRERKKKLRAPFIKLQEVWDNSQQSMKDWFLKKKEDFKKWRFNREYDKLMKK